MAKRAGSVDESIGKAQEVSEQITLIFDKPGNTTGTWILLIVSLGYFLLGAIDLVPDLIPVVGELDDFGAIYLFFNSAVKLGKLKLGGKLLPPGQ